MGKKNIVSALAVTVLLGAVIVSSYVAEEAGQNKHRLDGEGKVLAQSNPGIEGETEESQSLVSLEEWKNTPVGEYPINPDSPEWEEITYSEAVDACDLPKELAESLTTEELVKYAVNYPYLGMYPIYDSFNTWMDILRSHSHVFPELFARPDCNQELLKEYLNMTCDYQILEEEYDMEKSNYNEKTFLEIYFGLNYKSLSEEEKETFMEEWERKFQELPESIREYSDVRIFYDAKRSAMPRIPQGWAADPSWPFAPMWPVYENAI